MSVSGLNQEVEAFRTTIPGELAVSGVDTSALTTDEQVAAAKRYFETAIEEQLEAIYWPPGSSVTVTSISDEVVQYTIVTYADSEVGADSAIEVIEMVVNSSISAIADSVISLATSPSSSAGSTRRLRESTLATALGGAIVDGNTAGSATTDAMAKVSATGSFTVDNFDTSSFDLDQLEETELFFGNAITQALTTQDLLPAGGSVTITDIATGSVSYEIIITDNSGAVASSLISSIKSSLADALTLAAISNGEHCWFLVDNVLQISFLT